MQLKRLWDTDNKKIVFTEGPTGHQCQVWTDESGNLYIYDMAQWLTYNGTSPEGKEYDRSNWEALTDQVVGFYDTDKPSELYSWDHGDDAYYQFVDWDGTVLKSGTVIEGGTPTAPANPTREATAQYTYTFAGWTPAVGPITKRTTYTATYTATLNEYTITWVDGDGNTLDTDTVAYGATPEYTGATPTKAPDAEYEYTWDGGWTPDVVAVTGNATYTATFTATAVIYAESIVSFNPKNSNDVLLGGTTTTTMTYLPANATNLSNITFAQEYNSYDEDVEVSVNIVSFENGEATVSITGVAVDVMERAYCVAPYINGVKQTEDKFFTGSVYDFATVSFSTNDPDAGSVNPNSATVPEGSVITANDNVLTITNSKFGITPITVTATAIAPAEFSRRVDYKFNEIHFPITIDGDETIYAYWEVPSY